MTGFDLSWRHQMPEMDVERLASDGISFAVSTRYEQIISCVSSWESRPKAPGIVPTANLIISSILEKLTFTELFDQDCN